MKPFRNIFILGILFPLFYACSNEDTESEELFPEELTDIRIVAQDFILDKDSRLLSQYTNNAFTMNWEISDTLGIIPSDGNQVSFPIVNTDPNHPNSAYFTGGGWALKASALYAAYYPYIGDSYLDKRSISIDYRGQWQTVNDDLSHLERYIFMAANAQTPSEGMVDIQMQQLGCYTVFNISTPEPTSFSSITFRADEKLFVHRAKLDMTRPSVSLEPLDKADSICFSLEGVQTSADNLKLTLYFMFGPTDLKGKNFKAILRDSYGYEEEVQIVGKGLEAGHAYLFKDLQYVTYPKVSAPHWSFDEASSSFQAGMTAVVSIPHSMVQFMGEGDELAAFVDGELRGVGQRIGDAYFMVVHGNIGESSKVTFQYYNQKKQYMYIAKEVVDFNSDMVFGTADHPQVLPLEVVKQ